MNARNNTINGFCIEFMWAAFSCIANDKLSNCAEISVLYFPNLLAKFGFGAATERLVTARTTATWIAVFRISTLHFVIKV